MTVKNNLKNTRAGLRYVLAYRKGDDGFITNWDGTDISNGDQNGNTGGVLLEMPQAFPIDDPQPDDIVIDSETVTVSLGGLVGQQNRLPPFDVTIGVFDLSQEAVLQGTSTKTFGAATFGVALPQNPEPPNLILFEQNLGKSHAAATFGQKVVTGNMLLNCEMTPRRTADIAMRAPHMNRYTVNASSANYLPWGETIVNDNLGTCSAVYSPYVGPYFADITSFRGNAVQTEYFVARNMPSDIVAADVSVVVDRVRQTPTVAYTIDVATNKVTFQAGSIPAAGARIDVFYFWQEVC